MDKPSRFWRRRVLCLFALAHIAGCGASTGNVSGTVTFQGQAVASGTVIILGSDLLPYNARIQEDGAYSVLKVPLGLAKIIVLSPGPDAAKNAQRFLPMAKRGFDRRVTPPPFPGDPAKWFALPEKYGEVETSGLTLTVVGGGNRKDILLE